MPAEIKLSDLTIETHRGGIRSPVHVVVLHKPTGLIASAISQSPIMARKAALKKLLDVLSEDTNR